MSENSSNKSHSNSLVRKVFDLKLKQLRQQQMLENSLNSSNTLKSDENIPQNDSNTKSPLALAEINFNVLNREKSPKNRKFTSEVPISKDFTKYNPKKYSPVKSSTENIHEIGKMPKNTEIKSKNTELKLFDEVPLSEFLGKNNRIQSHESSDDKKSISKKGPFPFLKKGAGSEKYKMEPPQKSRNPLRNTNRRLIKHLKLDEPVASNIPQAVLPLGNDGNVPVVPLGTNEEEFSKDLAITNSTPILNEAVANSTPVSHGFFSQPKKLRYNQSSNSVGESISPILKNSSFIDRKELDAFEKLEQIAEESSFSNNTSYINRLFDHRNAPKDISKSDEKKKNVHFEDPLSRMFEYDSNVDESFKSDSTALNDSDLSILDELQRNGMFKGLQISKRSPIKDLPSDIPKESNLIGNSAGNGRNIAENFRDFAGNRKNSAENVRKIAENRSKIPPLQPNPKPDLVSKTNDSGNETKDPNSNNDFLFEVENMKKELETHKVLMITKVHQLETEIESVSKEKQNYLKLRQTLQLEKTEFEKEKKLFFSEIKSKEDSLNSDRKAIEAEKTSLKSLKYTRGSEMDALEILKLKEEILNLNKKLNQNSSSQNIIQKKLKDKIQQINDLKSDLENQITKCKQIEKENMNLKHEIDRLKLVSKKRVRKSVSIDENVDVRFFDKTSNKPGSNEHEPGNRGSNGSNENEPVNRDSNGLSSESISSDGSRVTTFTNGNKITHLPDGVKRHEYFNGDVKEVHNEKVIYFYKDAGTTQTTYTDGTEEIKFSDNRQEIRRPDGTTEHILPCGSRKFLDKQGNKILYKSDGTKITADTSGHKELLFPSGEREIQSNGEIRREYPDGSYGTVYEDGSKIAVYSNGRVRVRDSDGSLVYDSFDSNASLDS